jgi:hypothetical protein
MPRGDEGRRTTNFHRWFALLLVAIGFFMAMGKHSTVRSFLNDSATARFLSPCFVQTEATAFSKVWPGALNKLCPALMPQVDHGNTLIKLARDEIDMNDWDSLTKEPLFEQLFTSFQGGSICTSPEHDTMICLDTWKVAHQQLSGWARQHLERVEGRGSFQQTTRKSELICMEWRKLFKISKRMLLRKHHAL